MSTITLWPKTVTFKSFDGYECPSAPLCIKFTCITKYIISATGTLLRQTTMISFSPYMTWDHPNAKKHLDQGQIPREKRAHLRCFSVVK